MDGDTGTDDVVGLTRHVQVTFISKDKEFQDIPESVFDVPLTADCEKLNLLVNKTIETVRDNWSERRFEFLVGETFIRASLEDFIEEFNVDTETVIKVECVLGLEAPKPLHDLPAPDWVSTVRILPQNVFSTTYSGEFSFWNSKGEKVLTAQRDKHSAYKCSEIIKLPKGSKSLDGCRFVVGGDNQILTVFQVEGTDVVAKAILRGHERSIETVVMNSAGDRLISGGFDNYIKVWNLEDNDQTTIFEKADAEKPKKKKESHVTKTPMVTLAGHKDAVLCLKWSTWNKGHAVSASWDHSMILWDLELAGEVSKIRAQRAINSIDVNKYSGLIVAGSTDQVPRLFDIRSNEGSLVKQAFIGHTGWITSVHWSPTDERCFVSASYDKSVKMWDIRSAKTSLFDLHGHQDRVLCSDWEHGKIASGSVDCTVKVFQT